MRRRSVKSFIFIHVKPPPPNLLTFESGPFQELKPNFHNVRLGGLPAEGSEDELVDVAEEELVAGRGGRAGAGAGAGTVIAVVVIVLVRGESVESRHGPAEAPSPRHAPRPEPKPRREKH